MLEGLAPKKRTTECIVMRKAKELEPADYAILMEAIDDPKWTSHGLSRALRERGLVMHKDAIGEHRKGVCACARESQ
jgi:hypothetical protein